MRVTYATAATIAVLCSACRPVRDGPTAPPGAPEPVDATTAAPTPPRGPQPAFVVVTAQETIIVPVDPTRPVVTRPGIWVGTTSPAPGAVGRAEVSVSTMAEEAPTFPVCAAGDFGDPCELAIDYDDMSPRAALESASTMLRLDVSIGATGAATSTLREPIDGTACECVVVHRISTDGTPTPEFDLSDPDMLAEIEMSPYDPEEYADHCSDDALRPELDPTHYLGGVLYQSGMTSTNVCNGLNIYDGAGESEPLRDGAKPPALTFGELRCSDASMAMLDIESFAELAPGFDEDTNCGPDDVGEMEAYSIDNGQLVYAAGNINNVGGECTCVAWMPLSEATCPSSLDPCGSPRSFPALAGAEAIWVTTDVQHALVVENGSLSVYARDREPALRSLAAPTDILGVEFHPDTALLDAPEAPMELRPNIPPRDDSDTDFEGSAKAWGNRCFAHLKAGRLKAAEAACYDGLAVGGSEPTRGALTYNLGRIAEARGDQARALAYYYRSDGLRPGNAAVTERIAALSPH